MYELLENEQIRNGIFVVLIFLATGGLSLFITKFQSEMTDAEWEDGQW